MGAQVRAVTITTHQRPSPVQLQQMVNTQSLPGGDTSTAQHRSRRLQEWIERRRRTPLAASARPLDPISTHTCIESRGRSISRTPHTDSDGSGCWRLESIDARSALPSHFVGSLLRCMHAPALDPLFFRQNFESLLSFTTCSAGLPCLLYAEDSLSYLLR
jgi:hypothetical protein